MAAAAGAATGILIGDLATRGLREFAAFEQGMKNVGAVSGATAEELRRLDNAALSAAASTRFDPGQTTEALYALASSGQAANEQIATLPNVLNLAEAGQADLAQSTELLTSTLNQFGLSAGESTRVADVFVASIGASALNVNRLQVAFRNVGPTAAALNQTLEGTTAAVGLLTSAFGNGERAGTGLRALFNELPQRASDLGVSIYNASGQLQPLVDIIEQMEERGIDGAAAVRLFGAEAGPALAALLKQGSGALRQMEGDIQSTGQAAQTASKQLDTLQGDLDGLSSAVQAALVGIGRAESGVARIGIQTATNLVRYWAGYGDTLGEAEQATALLANSITTLASVGGLALLGRSLATVSRATATYVAGVVSAAKGAREAAIAEQAAAASRLRHAEAAFAAARANAALGASYAAVSRELLAARTAMTAADAALARTTATATAATVATRALGGAMALLGGPVGIALIAAYGIYTLATRQTQAQEAAQAHATAMATLQQRISAVTGASAEARAELERSIRVDIAKAKIALEVAEAEREKARAIVEGQIRGRVRDPEVAQGIIDKQLGTSLSLFSENVDLQRQRIADLEASLGLLGSAAASVAPIVVTPFEVMDEAATKAKAAVDDVIASLQFELDQLGRTSREQEIYNALKEAGVERNTAYGQSISDLAGRLYDQREAASAAAAAQQGLESAVENLGSAGIDALAGLLDRTTTWEAAATRLIPIVVELIKQFILLQSASGVLSAATGTPLNITPGPGFATKIAHQGAIVGQSATPSKIVHPAVFANAPRMHGGGIAGDEVPVIAKKGEVIGWPAQMAAAFGGQKGTMVVINEAPGGDKAEVSEGDDGSVIINMRRMVDDTVAESIHNRGAAGRALESTYPGGSRVRGIRRRRSA
ncbi:phage tail tape measure protein [Microbaculum marinum]|uniref:Phage tail tape measure protein n=2 Tax=Microbaculum marinum TaxID=1764581 RepID=A0AAW9RLN4_9HYPH